MATGKQMLTAVYDAIKKAPDRIELRLSTFDAQDLFKLAPGDLEEFGVDPEGAETISDDLLNGSLEKLSQMVGVVLVKDHEQRNLIPGEGFRRTAGILANGETTADAIVEEIRHMRSSEVQR